MPFQPLPALIDRLPGNHTRAPQTQFSCERQVKFLENLATTGSVRSAATAAGVSHQTVYRARRAGAHFRLAWDAAMVAALAAAEEVLAVRAIDGVEEEVYYHGEVVATRRRFDSRLLLAHIARLDRLTTNERVAAFADDFETALDRFARGENQPEPAIADAGAQDGENISSGQCNTRSMSPADGSEWDVPAPEWCPITQAMVPPLERRLVAMEAARPGDAPPMELYRDPGEAEMAQLAGFEQGLPQWWLLTGEEEDWDEDVAGVDTRTV